MRNDTLASRPLKLTVTAEAGLFQLTIGSATGSFVAADGQTLHVRRADGDGSRVLHIDGTADQTLYHAYEDFRRESLARLVTPARAAVSRARARGDTAAVTQLTEDEVIATECHRRELNDHTLAHLRGSPVLYAASLRWDGDHRLDELAAVVDEFAAMYPDLAITRRMQERVARFRAIAPGVIVPDLAGPSPDGETITLAMLRGRHVLVDFWASWCPPCRVENHHYAALHQRYRATGFEILAVSVDHVGAAWKRAIRQDRAEWRHISDLEGWKSPLAARFNVTTLPANFLIDPTGRIIAKNVRGENLSALLAQHLTSTPSTELD